MGQAERSASKKERNRTTYTSSNPIRRLRSPDTMGIPNFWKIVEDYTINNLPLTEILTEKKGIRIAIDGEVWIEECNNTPGLKGNEGSRDESPTRESIFNMYAFVSRLKPFLQYNCQILVVFDGVWKPKFKNNKSLQQANKDDNIEHYLQYFEDHMLKHQGKYKSSNGFPCCIEQFTRSNARYRRVLPILENLGINFVFACAESEALCSDLQKSGMFDYVLSNDTDTLLFGANKILKNFTKNTTDNNSYSISQVKIPFDKLSQQQKIPRDVFLVTGILLGGDYNISGINSIGLSKTLKLVTDSEFQSIVQQFKKVFYDQTLSYEEFQNIFNGFLESNSKRVFGRNDNVQKYKEQVWPSEFIIMHYVKPLLFHYIDPPMKDRIKYNKINLEKLHTAFGNISDTWFHQTLHEMFLLQCLEEIQDKRQVLKRTFKINKETEHRYRIRFKSFIPNIKEPIATDEPVSPTKRSPNKVQLEIKEYPYYTWIEKKPVSIYCPLLIEIWKLDQIINSSPKKSLSKTGSPRKRKSTLISPQKTTLDALGFFSNHTTPKTQKSNIESPGFAIESNKTNTDLLPSKRKLFISSDSESISLDDIHISSPVRQTTQLDYTHQSTMHDPMKFDPPLLSKKNFDDLESLFSSTDVSDSASKATPNVLIDTSLEIIEQPLNTTGTTSSKRFSHYNDHTHQENQEIIEITDSE